MKQGQKSIIKCGPYTLDYSDKTLIMGILNVTPDSFSDGGHFDQIDRAVQHAIEMVEQGADIIDVGGESTRPGYEQISVQAELDRVIPVIHALVEKVQVPISIDTYKAEVARQAVMAGAHIINDIWGAKADPDMAKVAAELQVPIILMHNRPERNYQDFMRDVLVDLYESIIKVRQAGVKDENIILDPGICFARDLEQNLETMRNLDKIVALGFPVLLGTSRKSMIGNVLNLPPSERLEGTMATVCYGIQKGCQIVRVHDVKEIVRAAKMMDALMSKGEYSGQN